MAPAAAGNEIEVYHHHDDDDDRNRTEAPCDDGALFQPDDAATRLEIAAQRLQSAMIAVRRCLDHGDLAEADGQLRLALQDAIHRDAGAASFDGLAHRLLVLADRRRRSNYSEHGHGPDTLAS